MAINDLIRPFAQRMTIETSITPPIDVDDPFGPTEGPGAVAQGKAALALLKPKITLYGAGGDPIIWSPYGEPSIFGVAVFWYYAAKVAKSSFSIGRRRRNRWPTPSPSTSAKRTGVRSSGTSSSANREGASRLS